MYDSDFFEAFFSLYNRKVWKATWDGNAISTHWVNWGLSRLLTFFEMVLWRIQIRWKECLNLPTHRLRLFTKKCVVLPNKFSCNCRRWRRITHVHGLVELILKNEKRSRTKREEDLWKSGRGRLRSKVKNDWAFLKGEKRLQLVTRTEVKVTVDVYLKHFSSVIP